MLDIPAHGAAENKTEPAQTFNRMTEYSD